MINYTDVEDQQLFVTNSLSCNLNLYWLIHRLL